MKLKETVGLIGVGNMGSSILEGLLTKKLAEPKQIWVYDKIQDKAKEFSSKTKVQLATSNLELVRQSQIILLAVKPQDLATTLGEIQEELKSPRVLVSILAGTPIQKIQKLLKSKLDIVRAMPNLGAKVAQSMTALCGAQGQAMASTEAIFSGCGRTIRLEEKDFDLITALSGSGPAYFFYLMELLAKEGEERGLTAPQAKEAAVQTALGAALLAVFSPDGPALLRERVTSKGGTTEAALKVMQAAFPAAFKQAIQAAIDRGRELSQ